MPTASKSNADFNNENLRLRVRNNTRAQYSSAHGNTYPKNFIPATTINRKIHSRNRVEPHREALNLTIGLASTLLLKIHGLCPSSIINKDGEVIQLQSCRVATIIQSAGAPRVRHLASVTRLGFSRITKWYGMENASNIIKDGDYIIIKRHNYAKIHKVTAKKCSVMLGKDEIDLSPVIGQPFWTTYKLERKGTSSRIYNLKKCKREISFTDEIIKEVTSGVDNREIKDDGMSQKLSTEEIINLRSCGLSGQEIVSQLVENSKTFMNKTEYSQEKYLKKKEKKYFEYVTVKRPTLRLILDVMMRQPQKVLGLQMDTLAQIISLANISSGGTYILYETGCMGVVAAAIIDRLGSDGSIVHVHPGGNDHPTLPVLALNLPREELSQLMSVDIRRLRAKHYQTTGERNTEIQDCVEGESNEPGSKRKSEDTAVTRWKKRKLEIEDKAIQMLSQKKADSLILVGKEHPWNIFKELIKYVELSRPFVVYCPIREPLQEMYCSLKLRSDIIGIRLTESLLRGYQILPERTHPDINIIGSGGYLLSGILVDE